MRTEKKERKAHKLLPSQAILMLFLLYGRVPPNPPHEYTIEIKKYVL